jgi:hypothetical protein
MELLITLFIGLLAILSLPVFLKSPVRKKDKNTKDGVDTSSFVVPEGYVLIPGTKLEKENSSEKTEALSSALNRIAITLVFGTILLLVLLMLSEPNHEEEGWAGTPTPDVKEEMIRLVP